MDDQLQGFLHNLLPLPKAGWAAEGVEGPALLPPPPGQGYEDLVVQNTDTAHSVLLMPVLEGSVDPEVSLEEWSEYTVQHWV